MLGTRALARPRMQPGRPTPVGGNHWESAPSAGTHASPGDVSAPVCPYDGSCACERRRPPPLPPRPARVRAPRCLPREAPRLRMQLPHRARTVDAAEPALVAEAHCLARLSQRSQRHSAEHVSNRSPDPPAIDRLSVGLRSELPGARGFSPFTRGPARSRGALFPLRGKQQHASEGVEGAREAPVTRQSRKGFSLHVETTAPARRSPAGLHASACWPRSACCSERRGQRMLPKRPPVTFFSSFGSTG